MPSARASTHRSTATFHKEPFPSLPQSLAPRFLTLTASRSLRIRCVSERGSRYWEPAEPSPTAWKCVTPDVQPLSVLMAAPSSLRGHRKKQTARFTTANHEVVADAFPNAAWVHPGIWGRRTCRTKRCWAGSINTAAGDRLLGVATRRRLSDFSPADCARIRDPVWKQVVMYHRRGRDRQHGAPGRPGAEVEHAVAEPRTVPTNDFEPKATNPEQSNVHHRVDPVLGRATLREVGQALVKEGPERAPLPIEEIG